MIKPIVHQSKNHKRIIIYLFVGGSAFIVEYISFIILLPLISMSYNIVVAQFISFCIGLIISFNGNRLYTFNSPDMTYARNVPSQISAYLTLAAINLCLSTLGIYILTHLFSVPPLLAKVIIMLMIVSWNFLIFNKLIFKTK